MDLYAIDYHAPQAKSQFVDSLKSIGFAVLNHHPLDSHLIKSVYAHWIEFFSSEEKQQYLFHESTQDGFFPFDTSEIAKGKIHKDLKEFFHFYPWGQCPTHLYDEIFGYYKQAHQLASELLQWIEDCIPQDVAGNLSEPLPRMIAGSERSLLRVLHYPPLTQPSESSIRAAEHEDINLITLLPSSNAPGLQVKLSDGQWLDVPFDDQYLIINTGDMLQEATKGYLSSTTHRVINPKNSAYNVSRLSLPLFLHPRAEVVLSEKYTSESYLDERLQELGLKN